MQNAWRLEYALLIHKSVELKMPGYISTITKTILKPSTNNQNSLNFFNGMHNWL